jgi:hypothetical protein
LYWSLHSTIILDTLTIIVLVHDASFVSVSWSEGALNVSNLDRFANSYKHMMLLAELFQEIIVHCARNGAV